MANQTEPTLDELQTLADAATPRPWFVEGRCGPTRDDPGWRALATTESYALATSPENVFVCWVDIDNLQYAAAICNAGPALIRRVRELEGALRSLADRAYDLPFIPTAIQWDTLDQAIKAARALLAPAPTTQEV